GERCRAGGAAQQDRDRGKPGVQSPDWRRRVRAARRRAVSAWSTASIRVRLTAQYALVLSLMLVIYAAATYVAVRHEFFEQLEDEARRGVDTSARGLGGDAQLREILVVLAGGLPLVVVLAGAGGYLLARRALAPIDHLAVEARRIRADRLHERLSVPNEHDEIGRLAAVINEAFARIESSF